MDFQHEYLDSRLKETLLINFSDSVCGNCGKATLPDSKTHEKISGYGESRPGCGVKWKYVSSEYFLANEGQDEAIKETRQDLEYIDPRDLWNWKDADSKQE